MSAPQYPQPSVLLCARDIRHGGGVAALASQLVEASEGRLALHRVGRAYPDGPALAVLGDPRKLRAHLRAHAHLRVVVLNPSARPRAILRDAMLARAVLAEGRALVVWWHGRSESLVANTPWAWRALLRWGFGGAVCHRVLTREMAAWIPSWMPDARVQRVMTAWRPALIGERVATLCQDSPWLYLGRLHTDKGLWDAVAMLERCPTRRLMVAGDGPEAERLAQRIASGRDGGRLSWLGHVTGEEKARALLSAQGLIAPSYGEGAPLAVLEAMGAGLPVVGYDVGAVSEMVEEAGHVVSTGDREALNAAMCALEASADVRRQRGRVGRARAARWTSHAAVRRLMETCEPVAHA